MLMSCANFKLWEKINFVQTILLQKVKSMKIDVSSLEDNQLRELLVQISLEWEKRFAVAPRITDSIAEYDAAKLVGTSLRIGKGRKESDTAVTKGVDFRKGSIFYQVKSNRPSGKPGSRVTLVGKPSNYNWEKLVWILYNRQYKIEEAWEFLCNKYKKLFESKKRISRVVMRSINVSSGLSLCIPLLNLYSAVAKGRFMVPILRNFSKNL